VKPLVERYHEVLAHRVAGIKRYGGRLASDLYGAPVRLAFPSVSLRAPSETHVRIGPLFFGDRPPILSFILDAIERRAGPINVVELGPGNGSMAAAALRTFPEKIERYVGLERDASVTGPYERIDDLDALPERIDLFIASEVIEHMSTAAFFESVLPTVVERMPASGTVLISTPNALGPTAIFNDFTHVQGYNFYDLYGLMSLFFREVDIYRTRYVWSLERLMTLLPRIALCRAMELDWCEGLTCVARGRVLPAE
jgi:hypothetical protein